MLDLISSFINLVFDPTRALPVREGNHLSHLLLFVPPCCQLGLREEKGKVQLPEFLLPQLVLPHLAFVQPVAIPDALRNIDRAIPHLDERIDNVINEPALR